MKKIKTAVFLIFGAVSLYAQKITKGSFSVLSNESSVNLSIDYTDSKIDKVPFDVFIEGENNWDEGYSDIIHKFVKAANLKSHGIKYTSKESGNYQLVFKAINVDYWGATKGNLLLLDKVKNVVAIAESFYANGGRFGSQTNLMGDAAVKLGGKVASFVKKHVK